MSTIFDMTPWNLLTELMNADRHFGRVFRTVTNRAEGRFPPVNVYVDDDAVLVEAELPGKTAKDVDLTVEPQELTLADRPAKPEDGGETPKEAWKRSIGLPFRVNADKATATFRNGILTIRLTKADPALARKIQIQAG